ncbi:MAG: helix-turn-helix transcriptional regulator [Clostridia bacterium]|nr:helix-turn-helix transcriptional regulator [Clostridia bacterium]
MTTGEKIAKCRKEKGLTQEQLAQTLGVTRQAVSRWEGDIAFPETDNLTKMCRLFGVSCDWLLNYDGEEQQPDQSDNRGVFVFDFKDLHFEYKSKAHCGKLPLVHINIGLGRVAKGVFALGLVAVGLVSVGIVSLGLLAIGCICLGLIAFGSLSAGVIAFGGVALGIIALGGLAVGAFSMGGCAVGLFACGGYASGSFVAVGDVAVGGIAIGDTSAQGSILSVLKPDYADMKEILAQKFDEIPKIWSVFTSWIKSLADGFMFTRKI